MRTVLKILIYGSLAGAITMITMLYFNRDQAPDTVSALNVSGTETPPEKEPLSTDELLKRLSQFEEHLIQSDGKAESKPNSAEEPSPALSERAPDREQQILELQARIAEYEQRERKLAQSSADSGSPFDLQQLMEEKRILEKQQDKLVNQILSYRKEIAELKRLLPSSPRTTAPKSEAMQAVNTEARALETKLAHAENRLAEFEKVQTTRDALQRDMIEARSTIESLNQELAKRSSLEANNGFLRTENAKLKRDALAIEEFTNENKALKYDLDKANSELATLRATKSSLESSVKSLEAKLARLGPLEGELKNTRKQTAECVASLDSAKAKIARIDELERETLQAKNALLLKETEVKMLSGDKKVMPTPQPTPPPGAKATIPEPSVATTSRAQLRSPEPPRSDVSSVRVIADKANLRGEPGDEHSPIMTVRKGSRLLVETKEGNWYRVIAPDGRRAYVRSDVVQLIGKKQVPAVPTVPPTPKRIDDESVLVPFGDSSTLSDEEAREAIERIREGMKQLTGEK